MEKMEKLRERADNLRQEKRKYIDRFYQERRKKVKHVDWFLVIEENLMKWKNNPKSTKEQKALIQKMLNCLVLMYAKIEMNEQPQKTFDFDFFDGIIKRIEAEKKELAILRSKDRVSLLKTKMRLRDAEEQIKILREQIKFHEETI